MKRAEALVSRHASRSPTVALVAAMTLLSLTAIPRELQAQDPPVEEELWAFVSSGWSHGTPYARAEEFRSRADAADLLRKWLDDPARARAWKNIVLTLGVIGNDDDTSRLRRFIIEGSSSINDPLLRERAAALQALAFLGHEADANGRESGALDFLIRSISPGSDFWRVETFNWSVTDEQARTQLTRALGHQLVLALSLIGSDRTGELLQSIVGSDRPVDSGVLEDALRAHEAVSMARSARREGGGVLSELYSRQQAQP